MTQGKHGPDRDTWTQKGVSDLTRTLAVKVSPVIHSPLMWAVSSAPEALGPPSRSPAPTAQVQELQGERVTWL